MQLSAQTIHRLCTPPTWLPSPITPMIQPYSQTKLVINGKSAGLSSASYDVRIDHDLVLGVNPAFILAKSISDEWSAGKLRLAIISNPPMQALAYTMEDFCMPDDVSGQVSDKSTYARMFVSAFNTFIDPGFNGNLTVELVNHGTEPVTYKRGDPLCQILFTRLDNPTMYPYCGKYMHQTKAAHGPRLEGEK